MSTGADCHFYQKKDGKWFYEIQEYPYGEMEDYEKNGPFSSFRAAVRHLDSHHANPGGYSVSPLPGCKHSARTHGECDSCGDLTDDKD